MNNYEPMWAKYYAPKLAAHEINQFRRAETQDTSLLLTDVIQPESFDPKTRRYMAVASRKKVWGRSHFLRAELEEGKAAWELQCLFTNALQMSFPWEDDFRHPSNRVEIAPHHILTIEFDSMSLPFFKQQLSWFRSEKKPTDSPIGKFVRHLRAKYADVAGLNVTYSGNKSFHYHFIVETSLIAGAVSEPSSARFGFQKAWDRLRDEFVKSTDLMVPSTERPDESLRNPENFRRLPNGMRLNDKEDHFFGVPVGDVLMQVVMWEHLTLQRSRGGRQTLLVPADFSMAVSTSATAPRTGGTQVPTSVQAGEEAYCAAKLEAIFNGVEAWPKFAGFDRSHGDLRAQFFNSPGDKNPTSMMRSDFATVMVQGANPHGLTNVEDAGGTLMPRLPRPLGEMMELWSEEHRQRQLGPGGRMRAPVEQQFADSATTKAAATSALGEVINDLIPSKINRPGVDLLCAPEGISKSGTLLVNLPRYHRLLSGHGLPSWIMFASPTYEGAEEKAQAFQDAIRAAQRGDPSRSRATEGIKDRFGFRCGNDHARQIDRERGRMGIVAIRQNLDDILQTMLVAEPELRLGENIDHLVRRGGERRVEVHAGATIPHDDLAKRKTGVQIVGRPQYAFLNPVLMLVENGTVLGDEAPAFPQKLLLPFDVIGVRHRVIVTVVAVAKLGAPPLSVLRRKAALSFAEIVRRAGHDDVHGPVRHLFHLGQAVAIDDRRPGEIAGEDISPDVVIRGRRQPGIFNIVIRRRDHIPQQDRPDSFDALLGNFKELGIELDSDKLAPSGHRRAAGRSASHRVVEHDVAGIGVGADDQSNSSTGFWVG